ncbi:hypothetical protein E1301_Tti012522 [Triplophysa tibetana]|uniref:Uncharacterized protein n=1 Tax=Triplophysa tibetana TaxID=1572043 RepID=A0A5A9NLX1_9TELE|nr:hypothetical protein E1301_Tti012522 [Triplophysa tibetana]
MTMITFLGQNRTLIRSMLLGPMAVQLRQLSIFYIEQGLTKDRPLERWFNIITHHGSDRSVRDDSCLVTKAGPLSGSGAHLLAEFFRSPRVYLQPIAHSTGLCSANRPHTLASVRDFSRKFLAVVVETDFNEAQLKLIFNGCLTEPFKPGETQRPLGFSEGAGTSRNGTGPGPVWSASSLATVPVDCVDAVVSLGDSAASYLSPVDTSRSWPAKLPTTSPQPAMRSQPAAGSQSVSLVGPPTSCPGPVQVAFPQDTLNQNGDSDCSEHATPCCLT